MCGQGRSGIELMRHGDTGQVSYRGRLDDALSPLGWTQLREASAARHCDRVVSSTLQRCAAFATELAASRGVPLRLDARLVEYDFGQWQGVPIERLQRDSSDALRRYWSDPERHAPPFAEPFAAFRDRVTQALDEIAGDCRSGTTLVVTHGAVIRLLRCLVEARDFGDMIHIDVAHASLHSLAWTARTSAA